MYEVSNSELPSGTILCGGKYVIDSMIGAGGFGITYAGHHSSLNKKVAIKEFFLSGHNVRNTSNNHVSLQGIEVEDFNHYRQRFIDEGRTLAKLNNEAVVKVLDVFDENGTSYMVMTFVEGVTLQNMVENDGPMDYEMAVNYIVQVCEALSYIHSKHILHRDVAPDNIIVTPMQKIVLIDFGSARTFIENKTQRHTTVLKKGFAPLEQYSSMSRKGAYTDIYSVGAVFYYLLTGECPLDATERTVETMKEPIELNHAIPEQINSIIMRAMEMNGSDRYQSAQELVDDIFSREFPKEDEYDTATHPDASYAILQYNQNDVVNSSRGQKASTKVSRKKKLPLWGIAAMVMILAVSAVATAMFLSKLQAPAMPASPSSPSSLSSSSSSEKKDMLAKNSTLSPLPSEPDSVWVKDSKFTIKESATSYPVTFKYTGYIVNGLPNGRGNGIYKEGIYDGPYVNGVREGENCTYTYTKGPNKDCVYKGGFSEGIFHGKCVFTQSKNAGGFVFKGYADKKIKKDINFCNGTWYKSNGEKYCDLNHKGEVDRYYLE